MFFNFNLKEITVFRLARAFSLKTFLFQETTQQHRITYSASGTRCTRIIEGIFCLLSKRNIDELVWVLGGEYLAIKNQRCSINKHYTPKLLLQHERKLS